MQFPPYICVEKIPWFSDPAPYSFLCNCGKSDLTAFHVKMLKPHGLKLWERIGLLQNHFHLDLPIWVWVYLGMSSFWVGIEKTVTCLEEDLFYLLALFFLAHHILLWSLINCWANIISCSAEVLSLVHRWFHVLLKGFHPCEYKHYAEKLYHWE